MFYFDEPREVSRRSLTPPRADVFRTFRLYLTFTFPSRHPLDPVVEVPRLGELPGRNVLGKVDAELLGDPLPDAGQLLVEPPREPGQIGPKQLGDPPPVLLLPRVETLLDEAGG